MMKLLFIAPYPPPFTGNSLPVKILFENLRRENTVELINTSESPPGSGALPGRRLIEIANVFRKVWMRRGKFDVLYLTVAESFAGNLRDLVIYFLCRAAHGKMVIHMLGGAGMKNILGKGSGLRFALNKYFIGRLGAIVVEGKTQFDIFARVADPAKISIIPNFAEDYLFAGEDKVAGKFENLDPLRVLFLSNMLEGKGHLELLKAYRRLDEKTKPHVAIDFAGAFESADEERRFLEAVDWEPNLNYHGSVSGAYKRDLFLKAHVFCLPTYYAGEGQPFSIIEAYATGCAVITTDHSGIGDVFRDGVNGWKVEKKSVDSLANVLAAVVEQKSRLCSVAVHNLKSARQNYTQSRYVESMKAVFDSLAARAETGPDRKGVGE